MKNYLMYAIIILSGFIAWILIFWIMRKSKDQSKNIKGVLLVGPAHFILKRTGYKLTTREIVGWGLVLLFMLTAPLISHWLEN
ncbi:putative membrane protein [Undibacterium sp. GrIS 1.2]|uniref:hypothetical protein n=1 Tax=Undibacterium sp. GrIS 1.2 TaxID=3143933 RepID=UPI003390B074